MSTSNNSLDLLAQAAQMITGQPQIMDTCDFQDYECESIDIVSQRTLPTLPTLHTPSISMIEPIAITISKLSKSLRDLFHFNRDFGTPEQLLVMDRTRRTRSVKAC